MNKDIIIKKSKIIGKGVFVNRDFKKGEVILRWNPKLIKKSDIENLSKKDKTYIEKIDNKFYIMQPPERFVNHSCEPNTNAKNKSDVAIRDIKKGEEITSNYSNQGMESFKCKCGSKKCRGIIN